MCGIAAIIGQTAADLSMIDRMNDAQSHRGPDGEGVALLRNGVFHLADRSAELSSSVADVAIGHRRLSILDLSNAASQPMQAEDGTVAVVYNGEIYNYLELRAELEALGHRFRSHSDTEVLLAAYKEWGTGCFARFNGMWALVLVDRVRQCTVLSRDRFGVKPLHFAESGQRLFVSSEIKTILAVWGRRPRLNADVAAVFLRFGLVNATENTFFDEIYAFPPGHFAEVPFGSLAVRPIEYWAPPSSGLRGQLCLPVEEAQLALRDLMASAVALRMRSDVNVGSCLSGGLDSSTIVAISSTLRPADDPMDTFTAGFESPKLDERRWASIVANAVGARHHVVVPTVDGFVEDWPSLVRTQDEPVTSTSMYAQWCIMRIARESGVKVLLDGQGGDETHGGYRKFILFRLMELLRQGRLPEAAAFMFALIRNGDRGVLRFWEGARYLPGFLRSKTEYLATAVRPGFRSAWDRATMVRSDGGAFEDRQIDDIRHLSLPSLLRYEDRNSMAFGVEARLPFLDYRVVEFLLQLSPRLKIGNGQTKALMRGAFRGSIPDSILDRRDKLGFSPPQNDWIAGTLGRKMKERLSGGEYSLDRLIAPELVSSFITSPNSLAANQAFRVFSLDSWVSTFDVEVSS